MGRKWNLEDASALSTRRGCNAYSPVKKVRRTMGKMDRGGYEGRRGVDEGAWGDAIWLQIRGLRSWDIPSSPNLDRDLRTTLQLKRSELGLSRELDIN